MNWTLDLPPDRYLMRDSVWYGLEEWLLGKLHDKWTFTRGELIKKCDELAQGVMPLHDVHNLLKDVCLEIHETMGWILCVDMDTYWFSITWNEFAVISPTDLDVYRQEGYEIDSKEDQALINEIESEKEDYREEAWSNLEEEGYWD